MMEKLMRKPFLLSVLVLTTLFSSAMIFSPADNFRKIENKAFKVGEKLTYNVNYGFVTAGIAAFHIPKIKRISGRDAYHVTFEVNTVPSFDWIFKVRDRYETYLDVEGLFPWRFEQHIREGSYSRDFSAFFDQRKGKAKTSEGEYDIPKYVNDIVSAFYLARTFDFSKMKVDDRVNLKNFYKNKVYIAMLALLFFVVGGYYVTKGAIGLGRQKDYQPVQPIYYSHKVHAGINQISCLYCHGSAWDSKHAAIPAVNICMNCHKAINTYEKGPKLYDESGNEINGTAEIEKLYKYAGFDPKNPTKWDPSKAKPIEWVKIHNLPDHVYFNHSQHIRAGKVQCQTCHGEITAMDEVKQVSELSMGWCVNCHRETKVDFNYTEGKGNKFYSIYEKFHNDIKNKKMDCVTVKDIGGLECQKCHY